MRWKVGWVLPLCSIFLILAPGCLKKILPLPQPAPTATPTPLPACGFTDLGSIGCKASDSLTVIRSPADWAAYQALPGCGTAVAGALSGFNFASDMVLDYDYHDCNPYTLDCSVQIWEVCAFWDRIEVHILKSCADVYIPNPSLTLRVCSGSAVSVPQSGLPVSVILCTQMGPPPPGGYPPCP